jgi:hypothetical protein
LYTAVLNPNGEPSGPDEWAVWEEAYLLRFGTDEAWMPEH